MTAVAQHDMKPQPGGGGAETTNASRSGRGEPTQQFVQRERSGPDYQRLTWNVLDVEICGLHTNCIMTPGCDWDGVMRQVPGNHDHEATRIKINTIHRFNVTHTESGRT